MDHHIIQDILTVMIQLTGQPCLALAHCSGAVPTARMLCNMRYHLTTWEDIHKTKGRYILIANQIFVALEEDNSVHLESIPNQSKINIHHYLTLSYMFCFFKICQWGKFICFLKLNAYCLHDSSNKKECYKLILNQN